MRFFLNSIGICIDRIDIFDSKFFMNEVSLSSIVFSICRMNGLKLGNVTFGWWTGELPMSKRVPTGRSISVEVEQFMIEKVLLSMGSVVMSAVRKGASVRRIGVFLAVNRNAFLDIGCFLIVPVIFCPLA